MDPGISARKPPIKRPALQQLLEDLGKVDLIAFTKLDRWTRNVKGYYDVQEKLDAARVSWTAILEDYETVTSNGRFKVNILLAVSEQEADRTSERIKVVMDRKVAKGEHLGPKPPLGYTVVDKRFVIVEEDAEIARGTFRAYQDTGKIYAAMDYLHQHGVPYIYSSVQNMLSNPLYAGRCRDNPDYCPAIIPPEEFDRVQEMLKTRSIRHNPTKREYIFSSMIRCASCGGKMSGLYHDRMAPSHRYRYRCDRHFLNHLCPNGTMLKEIEIEDELLTWLEAEVQNIRTVSKPKAKPKKPKDNTKKLERLNELYVEGIITKEQFQEKRRQLTEPPAPPEPDLSTVRHLAFSDDVRESYAALSREERRMLWRNVVESITADGEHLTVVFRSLW